MWRPTLATVVGTSLWELYDDSTKMIWSHQPEWMESMFSLKMLLVLLPHGTDHQTRRRDIAATIAG